MKQRSHGANESMYFWQNHINQFQQSGKSKMSYCKQYKLVYHRFLYWFSKLSHLENKVEAEIPILIPLKMASEQDDSILATMQLANGAKLDIHNEAILFNLINRLA